jgi:hypothetical protein
VDDGASTSLNTSQIHFAALDSPYLELGVLGFCTASFDRPHQLQHDRGFEGKTRSNFPVRHCAPVPDWLSPVNVIRNPQSTPAWSGAGSLGRGVLACDFFLLSSNAKLPLGIPPDHNCDNANPPTGLCMLDFETLSLVELLDDIQQDM